LTATAVEILFFFFNYSCTNRVLMNIVNLGVEKRFGENFLAMISFILKPNVILSFQQP
jgi:hypothetical protein